MQTSSNKTYNTYYFARNINELFSSIDRSPNLNIVGGCTLLEKMPLPAVSVRTIPELRTITKHERYLDFGPGATLQEILSIGEKNLPKILYEALKTIANPMIRNLATIGGNICNQDHKLTLVAPLIALDAKVQLKSKNESKYESLKNFNFVPKKQILSSIRIPLKDWDISLFFRVGPKNQITEHSASFAFNVSTEKNVITDVRLAFAGKITFYSRELEQRLVGEHLPLSSEKINLFIQEASLEFDTIKTDLSCIQILKKQFLNLTHYSLEQLT